MVVVAMGKLEAGHLEAGHFMRLVWRAYLAISTGPELEVGAKHKSLAVIEKVLILETDYGRGCKSEFYVVWSLHDCTFHLSHDAFSFLSVLRM